MSLVPRPTTARKRAFTLLELIVVVVVLGVLAAISIPTFARVIESSQDAATKATLSAMLHDASALMAFGDTTWDISMDTVASETSHAAVPGASAAGAYLALKSTTAEPTLNQDVVYRLVGDSVVASLRSPSTRICVGSATASSTSIVVCLPEPGGSDTTAGVAVRDDLLALPDQAGNPGDEGADGSDSPPDESPDTPAAPDAPLAAPTTTVAALSSDKSVTISWAPVPGAHSYVVQRAFQARADYPRNYSDVALVPASTTSYTDIATVYGEAGYINTYTYRVVALNQDGADGPPGPLQSVAMSLPTTQPGTGGSVSALSVTYDAPTNTYTVKWPGSATTAYKVVLIPTGEYPDQSGVRTVSQVTGTSTSFVLPVEYQGLATALEVYTVAGNSRVGYMTSIPSSTPSGPRASFYGRLGVISSTSISFDVPVPVTVTPRRSMQVQYRAVGTETWTSRTWTQSTGSYAQPNQSFSALQPGTRYEFQLRTATTLPMAQMPWSRSWVLSTLP